MRLTFLGTNSGNGECPAVYMTDRGTIVVQGKIIEDREALGDLVNLAADETAVEIPQELLPFFPQR
ncbi:hypothetical protein AB0M44_15345 [Streptosporangium subroseum]|uniref:hypothetical protein n=1 Tax=Streptosporangium subroseum TaxID=106412 RepID=UPI003423B7EB